jgi:hypothetical protein
LALEILLEVLSAQHQGLGEYLYGSFCFGVDFVKKILVEGLLGLVCLLVDLVHQETGVVAGLHLGKHVLLVRIHKL